MYHFTLLKMREKSMFGVDSFLLDWFRVCFQKWIAWLYTFMFYNYRTPRLPAEMCCVNGLSVLKSGEHKLEEDKSLQLYIVIWEQTSRMAS